MIAEHVMKQMAERCQLTKTIQSQNDRLVWLAYCLDHGHLFNQSSAAKEFGCSTKTIARDINYLRSKGWEISYDESQHVYFLKRGKHLYYGQQEVVTA